jgi:hypothetical protein
MTATPTRSLRQRHPVGPVLLAVGGPLTAGWERLLAYKLEHTPSAQSVAGSRVGVTVGGSTAQTCELIIMAHNFVTGKVDM